MLDVPPAMIPGCEILAEPLDMLCDYGKIPIRFEVQAVLAVQPLNGGLGGLVLQEQALESPWWKDYDVEGNCPQDWAFQFDLSNWGRLGAYLQGQRVGAALIAQGCPDLEMLEGRADLAVLWDLRVEPGLRGQGVGRMLFAACEQWARERGCSQLKVETQNVNLPACRFYQRMGCELGGIHRFAYPDFPEETQLLWYKPLQAKP